MNNIVDQYVAKLVEENVVDDIGVLKIRYAISALASEIVKTMVMVVVFYMLDLLAPFLFTMAIIIPVRIASGGLHFSSNIGCFLASLTFFILSVLLLPQIQLTTITYHFILLLSAAVIWVAPLVPSKQRPIISREKYLFNKYLSIIFSSVYVILLLFILDNQYFVICGIWALFLQASQLFFLNIVKIFRRFLNV
ncbi:accessory gene regulator ArgB-like protein [Sinanaerobacter chloroacetimidivorans]|uniref:Accessory gene regulator B family protein n=1 Tax=Sinanaerobacter chloroacetimidivorans TaxID=2818044 RepID=A0A8J8AZK6_9FIRM|nr:accessory gene regulator B family protein [Sinanaerobacter chloroacetimidivorans]MBR0596633.1 accessory gene regulator B family protein [Sinanaerobacter chloroacetimidivorans]